MQFSSKLTMATHLLLAIQYFDSKEKTTSEFLARSIGTSPVVVRRLLSKLQEKELIVVETGVGGAHIRKNTKDITLLDIYNAVEKKEKSVFHFHENPNTRCPVGRNMHAVLDETLEDVTKVFEKELKKTTLNDLEKKLEKRLENDK